MASVYDDLNRTEGLTTGRSTSSFGDSPSGSGSKVNNIKTTVADKLRAAASALHQRAEQTSDPNSTVANYGNQASQWLTRSADYVRDLDLDQVKTNVQKEVRQNPGRSLLIAGAAGLILGALFRRR